MADLINGAGRGPITAQQDADYFAGSLGNGRYVLPIGSEMTASIEDANTVRVADGVLVTQGRRIQLDAGYFDDFTIPNGTQGVTSYYIIGYHIYTDAQSEEQVETFVQASTADGTIAEASLRDGNTECYVSLYKVTQESLVIDTIIPLFTAAHSLSDLPFQLAIQNGEYGYINGSNEFVPFKRASGTATAAQVLTGYSFSNSADIGLSGSMPNRGSVTLTPTGNNTVSGAAGYYSGVIADGSAAYAAGVALMQITGDVSDAVYTRTTASAISYTIPANSGYKYVLVECAAADTGANVANQASMTNSLITSQLPRTSQSGNYSSARIFIGLASVTHTLSWPADSWGFDHAVRVHYFN